MRIPILAALPLALALVACDAAKQRPLALIDPFFARADPAFASAIARSSSRTQVVELEGMDIALEKAVKANPEGLIASPLLFDACRRFAEDSPGGIILSGYDLSALGSLPAKVSTVSIELLEGAKTAGTLLGDYCVEYAATHEDKPVVLLLGTPGIQNAMTREAFLEGVARAFPSLLVIERELPENAGAENVSSLFDQLKSYNIRVCYVLSAAATPLVCDTLSKSGILAGSDSPRTDLALAFRIALDPELARKAVERAVESVSPVSIRVTPSAAPGTDAAKYPLESLSFDVFLGKYTGKIGAMADN